MASKVRHPLEPLDHAEVQQAIQLLRSYGKVTPTTRFISVSLKEPPKNVVHAFTGGEAGPREAFPVLFDNGTNSCYETGLSLTQNEVLAYRRAPAPPPTLSIGQQIECE